MVETSLKKIIPISDTQAAIGAGAIMSFFVIWALIAGVGDEFVCWIGGKGNLSGWVQAFGSIAAIVSGFYVANWQLNSSRRIAKDSAHSAFTQVMAGIRMFEHVAIEEDHFGTGDVFYLRMHKALLEDQLEIARSINFSDAGRGYAQLLSAVRATIIQLIHALDESMIGAVERNGVPYSITKEPYDVLIKKSNVILRRHKDTVNQVAKILRNA